MNKKEIANRLVGATGGIGFRQPIFGNLKTDQP